jgi:outer membrane protein OmpA-like peptidoglycan-associated protein
MKKIAVFLILMISACSNKPTAVDNVSKDEAKPTSAASIEAKQLAAEEAAHAVTEIRFKKGSSELSVVSKGKLKKLLSTIGKEQKVDEIKLITWSDEEYPSEDEDELSEGQQILVRQRNARIKNFIRDQRNTETDIEMVSMAERSGKLSELWGDADARMKKSLEAAGIPNTDDKEKGTPKASRSIVMLILESKD